MKNGGCAHDPVQKPSFSNIVIILLIVYSEIPPHRAANDIKHPFEKNNRK